jgi:hypothetical protein
LDARLPTHIFWGCFRWFNWRVALLSQCCEKYNSCPATPFHDGEKTPILHGCAIFTMVRKYECWVLKAGNQAFHHGMKMHFPGTGIAEFFYFINV